MTWPRRTAVPAVVLVALYVGAAWLTSATGHRVRPLFEGFAPPPSYQWVHPPPAFSSSNTVPRLGNATVPFAGGSSQPRAVSDSAAQFTANFGTGAFDPRLPDTSVRAVATPLDPATLGALPAGLFADGNAYRLEAAYEPSGRAVDKLALEGDVVLVAPQDAVVLLYSPDGRTWTRVNPTQFVSGHSTLGGAFDRPGWFLAASDRAFGGSKRGGGSGTVAVAVGVAAGVVVLAGVGAFVARRRARSAPRRRGSGRGRPRPARGGRPPRRR